MWRRHLSAPQSFGLKDWLNPIACGFDHTDRLSSAYREKGADRETYGGHIHGLHTLSHTYTERETETYTETYTYTGTEAYAEAATETDTDTEPTISQLYVYLNSHPSAFPWMLGTRPGGCCFVCCI